MLQAALIVTADQKYPGFELEIIKMHKKIFH
jgi:hypothetical protein